MNSNWKNETIEKMKQVKTATEVSNIAYSDCLKNCKIKNFTRSCPICEIVKEKLNLMWIMK